MPKKKDFNYLAPFKFLGFEFGNSNNGTDYPTYCPFSEKENKLYVNSETGVWKSFTADTQGNVLTFLHDFYDLCLQHTDISDLIPVADDRQLPVDAFINEMAFNPMNGSYLIPNKNYQGKVNNLTSWRPKSKKPLKVPGQSIGLIGLEGLEGNSDPIYLCEGEWDVLAMKWLLKKTNTPGLVMGVPGALTFKDVWIEYFQRKVVHVFLWCPHKSSDVVIGEVPFMSK